MRGALFHISKSVEIVNGIGISKFQMLSVLLPYYLITVSGSFIDGLAIVMAVNLITTQSVIGGNSGIPPLVTEFIDSNKISPLFPDILPWLIMLFLVAVLLRFALFTSNGWIGAVLSKGIQETLFARYLSGEWSHMRAFRVGDAVATNTQQALLVVKYLTSFVSAIYFGFGALSLVLYCMYVNSTATLTIAVMAIPLLCLILYIFKIQSKLSLRQAELRNTFAGDITDRFNGLLQINVSNNQGYHLLKGSHSLIETKQKDIMIGLLGGVIGNLSFLVPLFIMIILYLLAKYSVFDFMLRLDLLAGIGALGMRAATQLNNSIAQFGNVSRLSGSLYPVLEALGIPQKLNKILIDDSINRVVLSQVGYKYDNKTVFKNLNFECRRGVPTILSGESGKGKTTLANLIAGLVAPTFGRVEFEGQGLYDSTQYRAKVGYVTQDIYMFKGCLRDSLTSGKNIAEAEIWKILESINAKKFVEEMGGLDSETTEAGRSLSGGQKRRLGIARVLLEKSDILIFDEITVGLDEENRRSIVSLIERLSKDFIVIVISHENLELSLKNVVSLS